MYEQNAPAGAKCGQCSRFKFCKNSQIFRKTKDSPACKLFQPMQNKYRNQKVTIDGHEFDSQKEAKRYLELKLLQRAGEVVKIELQPRFILLEGFKKGKRKFQPITYVADFRITYNDGRVEIEDTKGVKTEAFQIKHKLFEHRYPELTLKIL